ncbi:hypothetical protein L2E82_45327 [Cichorium intybus]|uniref:Uncharacterized protein n=1 Tax=Cichorium intybus TaxID=13427 RepID=A0ACB8ZX28_CICIN|nr:hypothetical protein L2E82_45327 [Cichorium intybus]
MWQSPPKYVSRFAVGLHDLRLSFGFIPQDPTLCNGTVRYNSDPLYQHTDQEIWELREAVQDKAGGLKSIDNALSCMRIITLEQRALYIRELQTRENKSDCLKNLSMNTTIAEFRCFVQLYASFDGQTTTIMLEERAGRIKNLW